MCCHDTRTLDPWHIYLSLPASVEICGESFPNVYLPRFHPQRLVPPQGFWFLTCALLSSGSSRTGIVIHLRDPSCSKKTSSLKARGEWESGEVMLAGKGITPCSGIGPENPPGPLNSWRRQDCQGGLQIYEGPAPPIPSLEVSSSCFPIDLGLQMSKQLEPPIELWGGDLSPLSSLEGRASSLLPRSIPPLPNSL